MSFSPVPLMFGAYNVANIMGDGIVYIIDGIVGIKDSIQNSYEEREMRKMNKKKEEDNKKYNENKEIIKNKYKKT